MKNSAAYQTGSAILFELPPSNNIGDAVCTRLTSFLALTGILKLSLQKKGNPQASSNGEQVHADDTEGEQLPER